MSLYYLNNETCLEPIYIDIICSIKIGNCLDKVDVGLFKLSGL